MATLNTDLLVTLKAVNQTTAAFNEMSRNLNGLKDLALKVGATLISAIAIRDVISNTERWAEQVKALQAETGMTAEAASRLSFAARAVGVDAEELNRGLGRLAKNMFSNTAEADKGKDAFSKWGVALKDNQGVTRNINNILPDIAARVQALGDSADSVALEMDLFGRSGGRLHELLMLGADGVRRLTETSDALGMTMNQQTIASIKEAAIQGRIFGLAMEGVQAQLFIAFLPVLRSIVADLIHFVSDIRSGTISTREFAMVVKVLGEAFRAVWGVLKTVLDVLKAVWDTFKGFLGTMNATRLAADLLVIALAALTGGPVIAAIVAVVVAFNEVKETIELIQKNWDTFVFALTTGKLNDIPIFGFFFHIASDVLNKIEGIKKTWDDFITAWNQPNIPLLLQTIFNMFQGIVEFLREMNELLSLGPISAIFRGAAGAVGDIGRRMVGGISVPSGGAGSFPSPDRTFRPAGLPSGVEIPLSQFPGGIPPTLPNYDYSGGANIQSLNINVSGNIASSEQELADRIADRVGNVLVGGALTQRNLAYAIGLLLAVGAAIFGTGSVVA